MAAALLPDLEDVLPLDKFGAVEREIRPGSVRPTCEGIIAAANYLNDHCGPAPAGWPGAPDGDENVLLDDSVIEEIKARVAELKLKAEAEAGRKNKEQQQKREAEQVQAPAEKASVAVAIPSSGRISGPGRKRTSLSELILVMVQEKAQDNEIEREAMALIQQKSPQLLADPKKKARTVHNIKRLIDHAREMGTK